MESFYAAMHHGGKACGTNSTRVRHDHARRQKSNTAIESFGRGTRRAVGHKPEDGAQMALADERHGCPDGTEKPLLDQPVARARSRVRCVSKTHAPAAG